MRRPRLVWQLYVPFVGLMLLALGAATFQGSRAVRRVYLDQTRQGLEATAQVLAASLFPSGREASPASVNSTVSRLAAVTGFRVTVIESDGTVVADTDEDPRLMENHAQRPEIRHALGGQIGSSIRYSQTIGHDMVYVALPVTGTDGTVEAVVRTSVPLDRIERELRSIYGQSAAAGLLIAILAAVAALALSRRFSKPLEDLRRAAARFIAGETTELELSVRGAEEVEALAEAVATLARQLEERIAAVTSQRAQQEALLAGMVEGVLAVDAHGRVVTVNAAAARLLDCDPAVASGKPLEEISRLSRLQQFVVRTLMAHEPIEDEIIVLDNGGRFFQAHGTCLRDAHGHARTAIVVLNDTTRLRRLEAVRREFVANVSHELKTPITSVMGFLDTLRDGAIDDPHSARRFVDIAARQADRLGAIIDDLLTLSRLEEDGEHQSITRELHALRPIIEDAIAGCRRQADEKKIRIILDCRDTLRARVDAALLEQALVNLIDNAVKYSDEGTQVAVSARLDQVAVRIQVADEGRGIEPQHIPRLFERFYRVDKARSRRLGGTGLGLAIVKHIVQVHDGSILVTSEPGRGSTFVMILPAGNM